MKVLEWLKSLLLDRKEEVKEMDQQVEAVPDDGAVAVETVSAAPAVAEATPAAEMKAGVNDFEAALTFLEDGVRHLGSAARGELVLLAKKYL